MNFPRIAVAVVVLSLCAACNTRQPAQVDNQKPGVVSLFKQVYDVPVITDTSRFIADLRKIYQVEPAQGSVPVNEHQITFFSKVKLYGSTEDLVLIEYDWKEGIGVSFPWKYQLLMTLDGKLIRTLTAERFEFVNIFPNSNPLLLTTNMTAYGNGGHELFKLSADSLENIYEGYYNYEISTIDAQPDLAIFDPPELIAGFTDVNKDGYKDLVFTGTKLMLGKYTKDSIWYDVENGKPFTTKNPAAKIPIRYVFPYDTMSGHFKSKVLQ